MGWLDFLKRGESADEALQAVAAAQHGQAAPCSGLSMLPPSHAAADVHDLMRSPAPHCAGRAFTLRLGDSGPLATVSHLEVSTSDEQQDIYDMVTWTAAPGTVPRFEAELGAAAWNHHRLADRFGAAGHAATRRDDGVRLRLSREVPAAHAQAFTGGPAWTGMMRLAQSAQLRGCVAEGLGDRLAVFTWTGMPHKGQQRWLDLLAVAQALDGWIGTHAASLR